MVPKFSVRLRAVASAFLAISAAGESSLARAADCKSVKGSFEEIAVVGPTCASPVGLCTVSQLSGQVKGQARLEVAPVV